MIIKFYIINKYLSKKKVWFVLAILMNALPFTLYSHPIQDTLLINSDVDNYDVYKHLYILKTDKIITPDMAYDSLGSKNLIKLYPNNSYSERLTVSRHYWLICNIKNNLHYDKALYYQLNSQPLDVVKAFEKTVGQSFIYLGVSGSDIPFSKKAYHYYDIVFPLIIKAQQTATIVLCINNDDGDNIRFLPQLRNENIFRAEEERFYLVTGVITGIMLTVFLLNLFLGFSLKEKLHYLYAIYIIAALYEIYTMQGIDVQFIYPDHPVISDYLEYFSPCILGILMTRILQLFLDQTKENSKIKKWVDIGLWLMIFMIPINIMVFLVFDSNRFVVGFYENFLAAILLVQCLLFVGSAVEKIIQGYKPAWFYLTAMSVFLVGLVEFIIMVIAGTDQDLVLKRYPNDIEIGIIVETVIVFLGIVYRYNLYKKEKEQLLNELNINQQSLIEKVVSAEEAERKRIAEDLHDDVGATLSALSMFISNAPNYIANNQDFEKYYSNSLALSNKAVTDIRNIAHNLLPKHFLEIGLFSVINKRVNELNLNGPIHFLLIAEGEETKLDEVLSITIYRIINELLSNINKHSVASEATIQILIEDHLIQIIAEDDGVGFDNDVIVKGIGLNSVRGRVGFLKGNIHVDSSREGTHTIINIPL